MVSDYYHPIIGGSEIQLHRLSEMLIRMGHKVSIVTRFVNELASCSTEGGKNIYRLPTIFNKGKLATLIFQFQNTFFLATHRSQYDIIHCHLATSTALGCLLANIITHRPVLIKFRSSGKTGDIQTSASNPLGRIKLSILKLAPCHFIAPSEDILQEMTSEGFKRGEISIIPNGIDTDLFHPISHSEKQKKKQKMGLKDKRLALYIGRLEPHKNIIPLIDAWIELHMMDKNWCLLIIGAGKSEDEIKIKIRKDGQKNAILYKPSIPPDEVKEYLQIADLFIQPSKYEGISNAILEAMSCALPVLASNIKANQGLIKDNHNGFLFNHEDMTDLKRVLEKTITDEKRLQSLGLNARVWVIEHFELSKIAEQYIRLYRRMIS